MCSRVAVDDGTDLHGEAGGWLSGSRPLALCVGNPSFVSSRLIDTFDSMTRSIRSLSSRMTSWTATPEVASESAIKAATIALATGRGAP